MSNNISSHKLLSMHVEDLKNLKDLEIDFQSKNVTAILGPNGNGKSTILHALASAFSPLENGKGEYYKFSDFFLPNTDATWNNSSLSISYSYKDKGQEHEVSKEYRKTQVRWTPRYESRFKREIYYIGIDKCVPMIESEKKQSKVNYATTSLKSDEITAVLEKASYVLNKKYIQFNSHKTKFKEFIGVEIANLKYSALSMSAGEQKVFHILKKLYEAGKYSLLLIDELDLLLHDDAFQKLLTVICQRAEKQNLQVIFTTHRESVIDREDINIRHIYNTENKTLCLNETKPDALKRLTGDFNRLINIFVEDDVSTKIIHHVCSSLKLKKYVEVSRFGAASNCFTMSAGLYLQKPDLENVLFVWDGDLVEYRDADKRDKAVKKVLTGDDSHAIELRQKVLNSITQYNVDEKVSPELFLYQTIKELNTESFTEAEDELYQIVRGLPIQSDNHKYLNKVVDELGETKDSTLTRLIQLASKSDRWHDFISPVFIWLEAKKEICFEKVA